MTDIPVPMLLGYAQQLNLRADHARITKEPEYAEFLATGALEITKAIQCLQSYGLQLEDCEIASLIQINKFSVKLIENFINNPTK